MIDPEFLWITLLIASPGPAGKLEKSRLSLGCPENRQKTNPIRINNLDALWPAQSRRGRWVLFLAPPHGFCA
jgi:hypothetical protein